MQFDRLKRRAFITLLGGAATWPVWARAQQPDNIRRIVILSNLAENDPEGQLRVAELRKGLNRAGWTEGLNARIDVRWAAVNSSQLQGLVKEIIAFHPDVIVTSGSPIVAALQRTTKTIPIVFVNMVDPLGQGFVASLARPGGNATGFTNFEFSMAAKWIELLKEIAPQVKDVVVIYNPTTAPYYPLFLRSIEAAASSLGITWRARPVHNISEIEELIVLGREPDVGVVVPSDSFTSVNRDRLIALFERSRVPAIYSFRYFAADGGLVSYGVVTLDLFRRASVYVDRILRGARPQDLPVQLPTKFELVINLRTAKALGLDVPATLLARADEVIE